MIVLVIAMLRPKVSLISKFFYFIFLAFTLLLYFRVVKSIVGKRVREEEMRQKGIEFEWLREDK